MNDDYYNAGEHQPLDSLGDSIPVLKAFYSELSLTQKDQAELWHKRGLTADECVRAGFKTNDLGNRDILDRLVGRFSQEAMFRSGLWFRGSNGEAKPNRQFYGYGLVTRTSGPEDAGVWGWKHDGKCNPVLIPYLNAAGELFHLRPHKGGIAGKPPRLYVARTHGVCDAPCSMAVITEGEYKSRALHAVLNWVKPQQFSVAALPGISMGKNRVCLNDLSVWLKGITPTRIVIVYDSEEKGDPRLAVFKSNPRKRHDSQVWARYLANHLKREGYEAAVAVLPRVWRDPKSGKVDWDSRLAARINELSRTIAT